MESGFFSRRQHAFARRPLIEALERRTLYSTTVDVLAQPDLTFAPAAGAGSSGYSPAQVRHAYGFDQVKFGSIAGDGSGQTIAIVDAYSDPSLAADLHKFDQQYGLADPPSLRAVNQAGGTSLPAADAGWAMEIALDVEWAHAIAPKANLLLVDASSASLGNLMTAVNTARHAAGVSVVSMSWGTSEFWQQTYYDSIFTTPAGHTGVTFVAAAGDNGSWSGPQWPSSSPNVLAVGGTTLSVGNAGGSYSNETAWSGSGGGVSWYENQPAWQGRVQNSGGRSAPDVAYNANPSTGFAVYDSYQSGGSPWFTVGGTSAGAPQWAALVAIADQGRALNHLLPLDGAAQTLPALYSFASNAFHDITQGRSSFFYSAGRGYDPVTGLGSPVAQNVIAALAGSAATSAAASSTVAASASAKSSVTRADTPAATVTVPPGQAFALTPALGVLRLTLAAPATSTEDSVPLPVVGAKSSLSLGSQSSGLEALTAAHPFAGTPMSAGTFTVHAEALAAVPAVEPLVLGAVRSAVGWLRSASGFPFVPAAADAAEPIVPASYSFVRFDPSILFDRATTALIGEMASLSSAAESAAADHPWVWLITGAVVAADAILVAGFYASSKTRSKPSSSQRAALFSTRRITDGFWN